MDSNLNISGEEFTRLANNFYISVGQPSDLGRIALDSQLANYLATHKEDRQKKYKVALCLICVNPTYWQFAKPLIDGAKRFFLPGHQTDFFLWSDIPESDFSKAEKEAIDKTLAVSSPEKHGERIAEIQKAFKELEENRKNLRATVFPIEPVEWPMPTLMRYHLLLQQEETLKEYDYIFYCDIDMAFVNIVGDEILGSGLTAVQQPMYAVRKEYWPPFEPNEQSSAYIKRPGRVIMENGRPRFMPLYYAGGFQGGTSKSFIEAMKVMRKNIDDDFAKNYVAIWNDETHWNTYLFDNPAEIILTPSYTYPDSLIKEYFEPMWGQSYQPKLVTLTKKFSFQAGAGEHLKKILTETKPLQK